MSVKKIIFIGGTGYSGSTLLDLTLSTAEDAFSCGEVCALFRPYKLHHFRPECSCGETACKTWANALRGGEDALWTTLSRMYPQVRYFVDSSKDLTWLRDQNLKQIDGEFDRINLLIWKTPSEYAYSRMKRGKLRGWKRSYLNYHKRYFAFIKTWSSVRYSDLARNPGMKLRSICKLLGMEYFPDKEKYWRKPHHCLFGSYSAKLHLYRPESRLYQKIAGMRAQRKPALAGEDLEIRLHRTIYHDHAALNKLPPRVQKDISFDPDIKEVVKILQEREVDRCDQDLCVPFKPYRLLSFEAEVWYHYQRIRRFMMHLFWRVYLSATSQGRKQWG